MAKSLKDVYTDQYKVCKGDSALRIAMHHGVTVREISLVNNLFQD